MSINTRRRMESNSQNISLPQGASKMAGINNVIASNNFNLLQGRCTGNRCTNFVNSFRLDSAAHPNSINIKI